MELGWAHEVHRFYRLQQGKDEISLKKKVNSYTIQIEQVLRRNGSLYRHQKFSSMPQPSSEARGEIHPRQQDYLPLQILLQQNHLQTEHRTPWYPHPRKKSGEPHPLHHEWKEHDRCRGANRHHGPQLRVQTGQPQPGGNPEETQHPLISTGQVWASFLLSSANVPSCRRVSSHFIFFPLLSSSPRLVESLPSHQFLKNDKFLILNYWRSKLTFNNYKSSHINLSQKFPFALGIVLSENYDQGCWQKKLT